MANDNYRMGDYDLELDPLLEEKLKLAQIDPMSPVDIPDLVPPEGVNPDPLREQLRQRLLAKVEGYDAEALKAEQAKALEDAGPSGGQNIARAISEAMIAMGGGKSNLGNYIKGDKDKRQGVIDKYKGMDKAYGDNLSKLSALETADYNRERDTKQDERLNKQLDMQEQRDQKRYAMDAQRLGMDQGKYAMQMKKMELENAEKIANKPLNEMKRQDEIMKRQAGKAMFDPNSSISKFSRNRVATVFPEEVASMENFDKMNAFQLEKSGFDINSVNQRYKDLARVKLEKSKLDTKKSEKMEEYETPYGQARTKDDAKKIKEGAESKQRFDDRIDQMIALRKEYGNEVWDRDAVERGKQLSKQLLLDYKNMAKLGVLSKSDEDIINQVIPKDPLAIQPSELAGQNPIMGRLTKLKQDIDKDFKGTLRTRLKDSSNIPQQEKGSPVSTDTSNAGKIVNHQGKRYRVAEDGDTLIPME